MVADDRIITQAQRVSRALETYATMLTEEPAVAGLAITELAHTLADVLVRLRKLEDQMEDE